MGRHYNLRMGQPACHPGPVIPAHIVREAIAFRCAEGSHRPETDAETGNEVCRHCGAVVDDYSDTGL